MVRLLDGRVALITGAGRGQGLSAAQLFAEHGAKLVITDLDAETVEAAVDSIAAKDAEAVGVVSDVSKSEDVRAALAVARERFGGLDILYNNAGIGFSARQRMGIEMSDLVSCTEDDWDRIMAINLTGVFLMCKYGVPMLVERGGGVVINTASIGGLRGGPSAHAYAVSKAGVIHMTRLIARTYGHKNVRANTICPGVIDTDMIQSQMLTSNAARDAISQATPIGRIGTPRDIAELALYLASDASSFVTGQAIAIDGGMTA
jgi:NAD(P)-dependent dehydrogenase (short-subunit alcohol dehydrogenase family)